MVDGDRPKGGSRWGSCYSKFSVSAAALAAIAVFSTPIAAPQIVVNDLRSHSEEVNYDEASALDRVWLSLHV